MLTVLVPLVHCTSEDVLAGSSQPLHLLVTASRRLVSIHQCFLQNTGFFSDTVLYLADSLIGTIGFSSLQKLVSQDPSAVTYCSSMNDGVGKVWFVDYSD